MNEKDDKIAATTEYFWDILKTVYDPEVGLNIVDLGLVYSIDIVPSTDGKFDINVKMTLTSPTCPLANHLAKGIEDAINNTEEASSINVDVVFDPPWSTDMITAEGKMQLGIV